jgi:hypothetical protein
MELRAKEIAGLERAGSVVGDAGIVQGLSTFRETS